MNKIENPRRALGRGIEALLPTRPPASAKREAQPEEEATTAPIDSIDPNPLQPRRTFHPDRLAELAQSIGHHGIIQPLVVRRTGDRYQLVAGERRWRAAKLAGLDQAPIVVREVQDEQLLEITLIENIQREDLNPIETAAAFARLAHELLISAEEIGRRTGKDRSTILNSLRLLQLPEDLQALVAERRLTPGHARCLLALPTQELQHEVAEKAVAQGWSVRETERVTQKMLESRKPKHVDELTIDPNVRAAIAELERVLGTKVRIVEKANGKGRIEIDYYSAEDLNRIYETIAGEASET